MQPASRPGRERPPYRWPKAAEWLDFARHLEPVERPVPAALFAMPGESTPGSIFPQSETLPKPLTEGALIPRVVDFPVNAVYFAFAD